MLYNMEYIFWFYWKHYAKNCNKQSEFSVLSLPNILFNIETIVDQRVYAT